VPRCLEKNFLEIQMIGMDHYVFIKDNGKAQVVYEEGRWVTEHIRTAILKFNYEIDRIDKLFIKDFTLRSCPKILVFDHKLIKTAPSRTLASGIADALAKWYESSITSSTIDDGLVQQAIQISRVLRDQLLIDGEKAFKGKFDNNSSWQNTVEACGLTAGLVGGLGGEKCRTAAAHAIHNAITQIIAPNKFLHGEIVVVGLLLQLRLEEMINNNKFADQSIKQLFVLMKELN